MTVISCRSGTCSLHMGFEETISACRETFVSWHALFPPSIAKLHPYHMAAGSMLFSCSCSLSAISAMNSEFVGLPLVFDTV